MNITKVATSVATVAVGVFIAGFVMNAMRSNSVVGNAISGFDS